MTRVLRSATKKCKNKEDLPSKLSICKNSKIVKKRSKKVIKIKNEDSQKSHILNISSIMSNIFAYTDQKDLLKFNTVCKKWNNITNPIIHKTIKLNRDWDIINNVHDKRFNTAAKIDAEVIECISNNAKYAHLVYELIFNYKLEPRRAIESFETFRFIRNLAIKNCKMSQDQFLGMISPLSQLQELTLSNLSIKRIIYKRLYKEVVQLPSSLKKLRLRGVILIDNPELFIQTINSHNNLVEFSYFSSYNNQFLESFYKPYPSLLKFEVGSIGLENPQSLLTIFENNHQLISLKLPLKCCNNDLISHINDYLTNLEELNLSECNTCGYNYTDINFKFSQPTKIKKLILGWDKYSKCSLNFILPNCPDLEELDLKQLFEFYQPNFIKSIKLSNPFKLKKLAINCHALSEGVLDSVLLSCSQLKELNIILPCEWKEAIRSIYEKCENLQRLYISPPSWMYGQVMDTPLEEFYEAELFTNNSKCKSKITHLSLSEFKAVDSKAEYFKSFKSLKSITYMNQYKFDYNNSSQKIDVNMDLWPGYKLFSKDNENGNRHDIEFKKF